MTAMVIVFYDAALKGNDTLGFLTQETHSSDNKFNHRLKFINPKHAFCTFTALFFVLLLLSFYEINIRFDYRFINTA